MTESTPNRDSRVVNFPQRPAAIHDVAHAVAGRASANILRPPFPQYRRPDGSGRTQSDMLTLILDESFERAMADIFGWGDQESMMSTPRRALLRSVAAWIPAIRAGELAHPQEDKLLEYAQMARAMSDDDLATEILCLSGDEVYSKGVYYGAFVRELMRREIDSHLASL